MEFKVESLSVARGGLPVLAGLSFRVAAGRAMILRGPNGAGKTTLLRALAGLGTRLEGRVSHGPSEIAYGGHADGVKAQLSVAENLHFWASVYGARDIEGAVAAFDLAPLLPRAAGTLSAGQKRRVSLARLQLTGRQIWCLDEPTVSLDADTVTRFGQIVTAHLEAGGIALIATHIELGLQGAETLDLSPFAARNTAPVAHDPFLGDAL